MEKYIKYKRIETTIIKEDNEIQSFLDDLIINGWEIINYSEKNIANTVITKYINVIVLVGKKQSNVL